MPTQADGGSPAPASPFMLGVALDGVMLLGLWVAAFHVRISEQADQSVFAGFAGLHRWREAYTLSTLVARLCDPGPYLVLAALPVLIGAARRRLDRTAAALALLAGANLTTELVKRTLAAPRPSWVTGGIVPSSTSWPSGHATAAMSFALACIIVAPARSRPLLVALGGAFAVAVSYAFMTLRWHYTSDVLGGFLVSGAWALLVLGALRHREGTGSDLYRPRIRVRSRMASVRAAALAPPLLGAVPIAVTVAVSLPHETWYAHHSLAFIVGTGIVAACGLALAAGVSALAAQ